MVSACWRLLEVPNGGYQPLADRCHCINEALVVQLNATASHYLQSVGQYTCFLLKWLSPTGLSHCMTGVLPIEAKMHNDNMDHGCSCVYTEN